MVGNCETNVLNLISPRLNTICQIKRKCYSSPNSKIWTTKHALIIACIQLPASRGYSLRSGNFCPVLASQWRRLQEQTSRLAVVSASRTYTYEKETLRYASSAAAPGVTRRIRNRNTPDTATYTAATVLASRSTEVLLLLLWSLEYAHPYSTVYSTF